MSVNSAFHELAMNEGALQFWHGVLFRQRPDFTLESISPHVQEWTGLEPGLSLQAIHPADHAKAKLDDARFRLRHSRTWRITWVEQRRRAVSGGYEGYWENITERMHLRQELAQTQWKATLGTATQRLVHDFNNLMTGILSLSEAYLLRLKADNPAREGLQLINQNARQTTDIVQNIGALFRGAPGKHSYQNLAELASTAADLLRRVLPKYSPVRLDVKQESIPVHLDATELKQVIVSLGLASTPPIIMEVGLEQKRAHLTIMGAAAACSPALLMAEACAERNDATFGTENNRYTFRFPEAAFSDADRRQRSVLLVAEDGNHAFKVAELLRRNAYEAVIGAKDLIHSPDYRFFAIVELLEGSNSLLQDADVVFRRGMSDKEMLAELGNFFRA